MILITSKDEDHELDDLALPLINLKDQKKYTPQEPIHMMSRKSNQRSAPMGSLQGSQESPRESIRGEGRPQEGSRESYSGAGRAAGPGDLRVAG